MNRDCNGTFFPSLRLYRCFGDGTVIPLKNPPKLCPHCRREVLPIRNDHPILRSVTITKLEVKDDTLGTWVPLQESKVISKLYKRTDFKDRGL